MPNMRSPLPRCARPEAARRVATEALRADGVPVLERGAVHERRVRRQLLLCAGAQRRERSTRAAAWFGFGFGFAFAFGFGFGFGFGLT